MQSRRIEVGAIVTLFIAVVSAAVFVGNLQGSVSALEQNVSALQSGKTIEEATDRAVAELERTARDLKVQPSDVDDPLGSELATLKAENETLRRRIETLEKKAKRINFRSGKIYWYHKDHPQLLETGKMSKVYGRIDFEEEFTSIPEVHIMSRYWNWEGLGIAINIAVMSVDTKGFSYELHAFNDTKLYELAVDWIALEN